MFDLQFKNFLKAHPKYSQMFDITCGGRLWTIWLSKDNKPSSTIFEQKKKFIFLLIFLNKTTAFQKILTEQHSEKLDLFQKI